MCNNWPNLPIGVDGATGGLIGDTVIICAGYAGGYVDECYSLTSEKVTLVTQMSFGRWKAGSIVFNDNTLWVTGGYHDLHTNILASTEYVTVTETMLGPYLPMALSDHAMVAINRTFSMVIGGYTGGDSSFSYSVSTFFYDHNEGEWITGPSLMQARMNHAAGIVTDEVTDEHFVAVTGGYADVFFDSTEILQDGEWVQGKKNICYLVDNFRIRLLHCTLLMNKLLCQLFGLLGSLALIEIKNIKILEAIVKLPAKQCCQFSPHFKYIQQNDSN